MLYAGFFYCKIFQVYIHNIRMSGKIETISLTKLKTERKKYFNALARGECFYVTFKPEKALGAGTFLLQSKESFDQATGVAQGLSDTEIVSAQQGFDPNLARRLDELPIKRKAMNLLDEARLVYVGDLVRQSKRDLAISGVLGGKLVWDELQEKVFDAYGFSLETKIPQAFDDARPDTGNEPRKTYYTQGDLGQNSTMIIGRDLSTHDQMVFKDAGTGESIAVLTPIEA